LILVIILTGNWDQGVPFKPRIWSRPVQHENNVESYYIDYIAAEDNLVRFGCCMMSMGSCILGLAIRGDTSLGKLEKGLEKWSVTVSYNPGICLSGSYFHRLYPGEGVSMDPVRALYWLNSVEISIGYKIGQRFKLVMGSGYLWPWKYRAWDDASKSYFWKGAWCIPVCLGVEKSFERKAVHFYRFQIEYYLWRYLHKEAELVQGGGVSYAFDVRLRIRNTLMLELSPSFRLGFVKEYKGYRWGPPLEWYPSGIYFKVGLFSPLRR